MNLEQRRAEPYQAGLLELGEVFLRLGKKAAEFEEPDAEGGLEEMALNTLLGLGAPLQAQHLPKSVAALYNSDKPFQPNIIQWNESIQQRKHWRTFYKTCAVCVQCGQGDVEAEVDASKNKAYKSSGCCGLVMYCSKSCAQKHWPTHKKVCYTRTMKFEKVDAKK